MNDNTPETNDMTTIFFLKKHLVHLKFTERKTVEDTTIMFFKNLAPLLNNKPAIYQFTLETWLIMRNTNIAIPDNNLKFNSQIKNT